MIDFPATPLVGEVFVAAGTTYTWNGQGWTTQGDAPLDAYTKSESDAKYVELTGDTMTGSLTVDAANPYLQLKKTAVAQDISIYGSGPTSARWALVLGDSAAESGSNAGSNMVVNRYNDSGVIIDVPFRIERSTGLIQTLALTINGTLTPNFGWTVNSANYLTNNGILAIGQEGFKPAGGQWAATSDARIKTVSGDYTKGLAAIKQLVPKNYTYKANDTRNAPEPGKSTPYPDSAHAQVLGKTFVGLVAQDVEGVMPEMVTQQAGFIDGAPVSDMRILNTTALIYALVNAVKELSARVEALETTP